MKPHLLQTPFFPLIFVPAGYGSECEEQMGQILGNFVNIDT